MRSWTPGQSFPRQASVHVMHYPSNRLWAAIVYAAGDFPSQGLAGAGLPAFITPPEDLDPGGRGSDVVIRYTIGFTHIPRPEDHPVMPSESLGFRLVPHGFFDRNPALDVPDRTPPLPNPGPSR